MDFDILGTPKLGIQLFEQDRHCPPNANPASQHHHARLIRFSESAEIWAVQVLSAAPF